MIKKVFDLLDGEIWNENPIIPKIKYSNENVNLEDDYRKMIIVLDN